MIPRDCQREFPGACAALAQSQSLQLSQRTLQRGQLCAQVAHGRPVVRRVIGRTHSPGGQLDMTGAVQFEHQAAGHHVAWLAIGLNPVPSLAQFGRESPPT